MTLTQKELDAIEARETLTGEEVQAFLELVNTPTAFLFAHGWRIEHTALTKSCANKLRRIAWLPREGDVE